MALKAIDANNATHSRIVNEHQRVIDAIENDIDKAINEGRFSCASSYTVVKPVLNPVRDYFKELGYYVNFVNDTPRSTIIAVSWDDVSLNYARNEK